MSERFSGYVEITDATGEVRIHLSGEAATMFLGGGGADSQIVLHPAATPQGDQGTRGLATVVIDGRTADIRVGGNGLDADLRLHPGKATSGFGRTRDATIHLGARHANVRLGGHQEDGDLGLFVGGAEVADLDDLASASVHLDGGGARLRAGGNGANGDLQLVRSAFSGEATEQAENAEIHLDAARGRARLGGPGTTGRVALYAAGVRPDTLDDDDAATILLDGGAGDIRLGNADVAEEFDLADGVLAPPGTVVVLDDHGRVAPCSAAASSRVVGVVSGAGGYRPGIVLDSRGGGPSTARSRVGVAMVGKVGCLVDATAAALGVGDLLVTSPRSGHAMPLNPVDAQPGTILGKALGRLDRGTGLVDVLVALQ